jgi:HD-like signal output (HDOD) protein
MVTKPSTISGSDWLHIKYLPPLSVTANRLLGAVSDPEVEIQAVVDIINQDPGLAARIVGMANSAYFGLVEPIYSVRDAIIRVLGLNMVKSLALGVAINGVFRADRCPGFNLKEYWFRSISCAMLARMLAVTINSEERPDPDSVYLCGLLYSIGELLLAHLFPKEFSRVLTILRTTSGLEAAALQQEQLGIDAVAAGEWLVRRWHLPEAVIQVIGSQEPKECDPAYRCQGELVTGIFSWLIRPPGSGGLAQEESLRRIAGLGETSILAAEASYMEQCQELEALSELLS